jgi:2-polyprenyl-3-methyl-5-hydroxy-6-metoxy-1,4-benzoquinol methylase
MEKEEGMTRICDPDNREAAVLGGLVSFEGLEVMDVGCGEGRTSRTIARTAAAVTGVDPDAERIEIAQDTEREPGSCPITFIAGGILELEPPASSYDAVVFGRSL